LALPLDIEAVLPFDISAPMLAIGLERKALGRLDVRFEHRNYQRDYFAFESKRLHVSYPGGSFSTEYPASATTE